MSTLIEKNLSFLTDACRVLKFNPTLEGYSLQGHVFKSLKVRREAACEAWCYVEHNCMSYNIGPLDEDETHICELSDSDHQIHTEALVRKNGFTYTPTEVSLFQQGIAPTFFKAFPQSK